jgi:hypothetical protein
MITREAFDWLKPSPLWHGGLAGAHAADFFQPQLLEFDDDNFVDAFRKAAAASDPTQLKSAVLTGSADHPLKLFQPAHGRFYLVSAALSCRLPGFPERVVQLADGESAFFVMRKFVAGAEYGWVVDGTSKSWQPLNGQARRILDKEERLPLFHAAGSDKRTILVGYVPAASREVYSVSVRELNAAMSPDEQAHFPNGIDLRIEELQARFTTPLKKNPAEVHLKPVISVYMLLDLLDFFATHLPKVAAALTDSPTGVALSAAEQQLMAFLAGQSVGGGPALDAALRAVARQRPALEAVGGVDPVQLGLGSYDLTTGHIDTIGLEVAVRDALPPDPSTIQLPRQSASPAEIYALRCVYERPQCAPPLQVVSQPSVPFELATFFDGDAPARPVRIVLPTDVSLAGIRKFHKGVTFMISGSMQQKINMLTGHEKDIITGGSPGSDANGLSWMCSFSIQIIFIVAFFLLLMFVIILNIVFWWIAFFRICIPIPKKLLSG